jgi:hypothetical protein
MARTLLSPRWIRAFFFLMRGARLTFVSWLTLASCGAAVCLVEPVRAADALGAQGESEDRALASKRAAEASNRRHYLGIQLGGSGALQVVYRVRTVERLHLEVGAFASAGAINGSAGVFYDFPISTRTALYVSGGGAFIGAAGEHEPCDQRPGCVDSSVSLFVYARAGDSFRPGDQRRDVLGFDVGLWRGTTTDYGPTGNVVRAEPLLLPMAGFSYHYAL